MPIGNARKLGLPWLMPERFAEAHNVLIEEESAPSEMFREMFGLSNGWRFIGWTYAEQESSGGRPFSYLCMFEKEDTRVWCQIPESQFLDLVKRLHKTPSEI